MSGTCPAPSSVFATRFARKIIIFVLMAGLQYSMSVLPRLPSSRPTGKTLYIDHLPLNDDQSHAGIFGYTANDLLVAVELKALVRDQDVHLAVT